MSKKKELTHISKIVESILEHDSKARNSDVYLYLKVCEYINHNVIDLPFVEVLNKLNDYGLPNFETVRRTRQRIQQLNFSLSASSDVEAYRHINEQDFKDFSRGY